MIKFWRLQKDKGKKLIAGLSCVLMLGPVISPTFAYAAEDNTTPFNRETQVFEITDTTELHELTDTLDLSKNKLVVISDDQLTDYQNALSVTQVGNVYYLTYSSDRVCKLAKEHYEKSGYDVSYDEQLTTDTKDIKLNQEISNSDTVKSNDLEAKTTKDNAKNNTIIDGTAANSEASEIKFNDVVVGIIDSGLNPESEFLKDRLVARYQDTAVWAKLVNTDAMLMEPYQDTIGHGTLIAETIAALTEDNVKFASYKVTDDEGSTTVNTLVAAIYACIEDNVDIINISIAGKSNSKLLEKAINDATDAGITVVVSAGNYGEDTKEYTPANIDNAIVVSATDNNGVIADYSNTGNDVDYSALGEITYNKDNSIKKAEGTSFATARVSAFAALAKSYSKNINIIEVFDRAASDLGDTGYDIKYGTGYLNKNAVLDVLKTCVSVIGENAVDDTDKNYVSVKNKYLDSIKSIDTSNENTDTDNNTDTNTSNNTDNNAGTNNKTSDVSNKNNGSNTIDTNESNNTNQNETDMENDDKLDLQFTWTNTLTYSFNIELENTVNGTGSIDWEWYYIHDEESTIYGLGSIEDQTGMSAMTGSNTPCYFTKERYGTKYRCDQGFNGFTFKKSGNWGEVSGVFEYHTPYIHITSVNPPYGFKLSSVTDQSEDMVKGWWGATSNRTDMDFDVIDAGAYIGHWTSRTQEENEANYMRKKGSTYTITFHWTCTHPRANWVEHTTAYGECSGSAGYYTCGICGQYMDDWDNRVGHDWTGYVNTNPSVHYQYCKHNSSHIRYYGAHNCTYWYSDNRYHYYKCNTCGYWYKNLRTYTINFNPNTPSNSNGYDNSNKASSVATTTKNQIKQPYDNILSNLPSASLTGWTFDGWYDTPNKDQGKTINSKINSNSAITDGANDTTTVYAHYHPNQYTITFDYAHDSSNPYGDLKYDEEAEENTKLISGVSTKTVTYDQVVGNLPEPTLTGAEFIKWVDDNGREYTEDTFYRVTDNITLHAVWKELPGELTYNANGITYNNNNIGDIYIDVKDTNADTDTADTKYNVMNDDITLDECKFGTLNTEDDKLIYTSNNIYNYIKVKNNDVYANIRGDGVYTFQGWSIDPLARQDADTDAKFIHAANETTRYFRLMYESIAFKNSEYYDTSYATADLFKDITTEQAIERANALRKSANDLLDDKSIVSADETNITMYAVWDKYPEIQTKTVGFLLQRYDKYLNEDGTYQRDELKKELTEYLTTKNALYAYDREDGDITSDIVLDGIDEVIQQMELMSNTAGYNSTEMKIRISVKDSVGHTTYSFYTIDITQGQPGDRAVTPNASYGYVGQFYTNKTRGINKEFYNTYYENEDYSYTTYRDYGGLVPDSIWYTNPEYKKVITQCFDNFEKGTPEQKWYFTRAEVEEVQKYVEENGLGNMKNKNALSDFYNKYSETCLKEETDTWNNTYTIKYDANGGSGVVESQENIIESNVITLQYNNFTAPENKHFIGWSKDPNAIKAEYKAGEQISGLSSIDGDVVTLYAVWSSHNYAKEIIQPKTCTQEEITEFTCIDCGHKETKKTAEKLGHKYNATIIQKQTCEDEEITEYTCERCGDKYTETTDTAAGHYYRSEVIQQQTCELPEITRYTCTGCGDSFTRQTKDIREHEYEITTVEATCEDEGKIIKKCKYCGIEDIEVISAKGHEYESEIIQNQTCLDDEITKYTCKVCGTSYEEITKKATGHDYEATVKEATCTEEEVTTYTCKNCSDTYEVHTAKAKGHTYVATKITKLSCLTPEETQYICKDCHDTYTTKMEAPGHDEVYGGTAAVHTKCDRCGTVLSTVHTYTKTTVKAATCTTKGTSKYTCACGYSYTADDIPALGHTGNEGGTVTQYVSCTANGYRYYRCTRCHQDYGGTYIYQYAYGHNSNGSTTTGYGTCGGSSGYKYCTNCGTTMSTWDDRHGHNMVTVNMYWDNDNGEYLQQTKCSYCGAIDPGPYSGYDHYGAFEICNCNQQYFHFEWRSSTVAHAWCTNCGRDDVWTFYQR